MGVRKKTKAEDTKPAAEPRQIERMMTGAGAELGVKAIPTAGLKVIGIVANPNTPKAVRLAQEIATWVEKKACKDTIVSPGTTTESIVRSADFIVTVGGDGTLLSLAKHMMERAVPVFGINMGHLGFLTGARPDEAISALEETLRKPSLHVEQRLMLRARVQRRGEYLDNVFQALNDAVINREGLTRYVKVEINVGEETYSHFFGDGVIVATPTGSTAYSMSAGGPVLLPTLSDIIITAICPHASALRSMVVPGNEIVRVRVFTDQPTDRALLTTDGGDGFELEWGDVVECTRSPVLLPLVKSSRRTYFGVLREKFKIPLEGKKRA